MIFTSNVYTIFYRGMRILEWKRKFDLFRAFADMECTVKFSICSELTYRYPVTDYSVLFYTEAKLKHQAIDKYNMIITKEGRTNYIDI